MLQQRVASCQQHHVESTLVHEVLRRPPVVDAEADRRNDVLLPHLGQRAERAVPGLSEVSRVRSGLVHGRVEVVDQGDVDSAEAEALETVLQRAPRRVVAVVEHRPEGQGIAELRSS